MGFFSALKLAMLGLLVVALLSPAAGVSFFKKAFLTLAALFLLALVFRNRSRLTKFSVYRHVH
ncbi:hypothetical protein Pogu_2172 [Pyrobaculum oguniense TE7]|uniref:Uncharacterized protein n=1 Tax=Pyrobaculum oguniense (strain DSM 13380 / JCM 10595 / TE7) TaxID=698757 RepID=H6QBC3_PYROT|nr:hypothetical protein Pogu_2172 [Pyrobaculum oguniense TE7]